MIDQAITVNNHFGAVYGAVAYRFGMGDGIRVVIVFAGPNGSGKPTITQMAKVEKSRDISVKYLKYPLISFYLLCGGVGSFVKPPI